MESWFLHVDLDAFFASVEQLDHPEYRGKPLIVGGLPTDPRSVVSTASYEARKFGVHSAMPTAKAYKLCPEGIYVRGNMKRYEEMSYQIMQIFKRYSPNVMQMSIDEAFIDLTGTEKLFGPPEKTAMEIKRVVKEETGLTVSIGLSRSKYFAKVSSGLNKPDGFYFMEPGTETDFMLRQPIEKIWGIGGKTAKRIFDSGIKTTKQLYEKSLDVLTFMYGESTGTFLYNIIRGNADGMFDGEAKSHSISNERTFPFDVTDIYTNETALLELAHSVMFRLLRDNLSSRTVVIKIRYEDFTTVSIRQTYTSDILTLDSFYEKVKDLFEKKYETGRGVRLLGVGFDNVKSERSTYQQDLFDDGEKKKQAVEQAILKIEKKFPDVHVQKARLLKPKLILFFALLLGFFTKPNFLYARDIDEVTSETLFDFDIKDKNVEFLASGFWEMQFTDGVIMAFNGGQPLSISFGVPVFKQKVDLSAWVMIDKKWYFEASFADEFKKNTIAFGYIGDGIIKSARISNRNITYPTYYSSNIFGYNPGGGENQAPGFELHLEKDKLFADFLIRYDMQKTQSATFYGYNSVTDTEIRLNDYITGRYFVIPYGYVSKIKDVYVESSAGNISDSSGRKYQKLSSSQIFVLPTKSTLILSEDARAEKLDDTLPTVLVTFTSENDADSLITKIGSYDDEKTFLGKIQKYFNTSQTINLENYTYGKTNDSLKTKIENDSALILQSQMGFSPFVNASNYDFGLESDADVFIYSKSNDMPNSEYFISETKDTLLFSEPDFFNQKHSYGTVFTKQVSESDNLDFENDVSLRFPLAASNPLVYLNSSYESDLSILLRLYSAIPSIRIPSGVSSGLVRVYKNGILDAGAKYDTETGNITLSTQVLDTDKIYVTWAEETDSLYNGKLTGAIGAGYQYTENLKGDLDITASWPISPLTKYAAPNDVQNGYAALSSGIYFEKENFSISDAVSLSLESENVTGSIIVLESKGSTAETFYLSSTVGYQTYSVPVLNTKEISDSQILSIENKTSPGNLIGETDKNISGYRIPIEVNFSSVPNESVAWTSADILLTNGNFLLNGDTFNIALKQQNLSDDFDVYLQLGCFANKENIKISEDLIPTWKITGSDSDVSKPFKIEEGTDGQWQIVSVKLSDGDRARFASYHDARIIVVSKSGTSTSPADRTKSGFIYAGPYETETIAFETFSSNGISVKSSSVLDASSPSSKKFDKSNSYVNKIEWQKDSETLSDAKVRFGSFFPKTDYSNYKKIRFDFKMYDKTPENTGNSAKCNTFYFMLENGAKSIADDGIPSVKLALNGEFVTQNDDLWHFLEIDENEKSLYIDGNKIDSENYDLYINSAVTPSAMKIELDGVESGTFCFDTLYFDGTSPYLKAQNYFATSYKIDGEFVSVNDTPILSDFEVNMNSRQSGSLNTGNKDTSALVQGFIESGVTLTQVRLQADTSLSSSNKKVIDNAGHSIQTVSPILKSISFDEKYRFNTIENSTEKKDSISFDMSDLFAPIILSASTGAKDSSISKTQDIAGDISFTSKYVLFNSGIKLNQKINTINQKDEHNPAENYFISYGLITTEQFSGGEKTASSRADEIDFSTTGKIPFANLSPKISYKINGEYKSVSETAFTGAETFGIEIPFSINKQSINLSWKKQGEKIDAVNKGGNYKSDLEKSFSDINDMDYFYKSIIFYDLFDDNLQKKIHEKNILENSNGMNFLTNYSIKWNRNLFNNIKDLYIPMNAAFQVERNIKTTETISDIHQYKFSVGNSFINLFGSDSKLKTFKWYSQDEFSSIVEFTLKVPRENKSNFTYGLSLYEQLIFYISDSHTLKTAGDLFIEQTGNWSLRESVIYSYPGKSTPLLSLFELFYRGSEKLNAKISRKDTFNMELKFTDLEKSERFEISHICDVNFLKYYTISFGGVAGYTHNKIKSDTIELNLTLGGKMEF